MNLLDTFAGWKLRIALGVLLIVVFVGWTAYWADQGRQAQVKRDAPVFAAYEVRIARLLDMLKSAEDKLRLSNEQVDQLKADADARAVKAAADLRAAKSLADRYRLRASQIAAARPSGDQCEAAASLIRSTLAEERK